MQHRNHQTQHRLLYISDGNALNGHMLTPVRKHAARRCSGSGGGGSCAAAGHGIEGAMSLGQHLAFIAAVDPLLSVPSSELAPRFEPELLLVQQMLRALRSRAAQRIGGSSLAW